MDAATAVDAEVRLYDNLFTDANPDAADKDFIECLNPGLSGGPDRTARWKLVWPPPRTAAEARARRPRYQFMRLGYFCLDNKDYQGGPSGVQPQRQPEG